MEVDVGLAAAVAALAFVCEYVDATLGMGYGTALTPLLLIIGFSPHQVVPAILFSQFLAGLVAGFWHHRLGNIFLDFRRETKLDSGHPVKLLLRRLGVLGYFPRSHDAKVVYVLAACGIVGVLAAVFVAVSISKAVLEAYIGAMLVGLGVLILATQGRRIAFSWRRLLVLGVVSAFNKGISGGGYGPLLTGGQMLSGAGGANAVGNTTVTEALVCLVGFLAYLAARGGLDWRLTLPLALGAVASTPLSAWTTRRLGEKRLRVLLATAILLLGVVTLVKVF